MTKSKKKHSGFSYRQEETIMAAEEAKGRFGFSVAVMFRDAARKGSCVPITDS